MHGPVLWEETLRGNARVLDLGEVDIVRGMNVSDNGVIAFSDSTATHTSRLYMMDSVNTTPRRLTEVNAFVGRLTPGCTQPMDSLGP